MRGGGKGGTERTWAARSIRARNLQNRGEASLPARRALGPQGPGEAEWAEPGG